MIEVGLVKFPAAEVHQGMVVVSQMALKWKVLLTQEVAGWLQWLKLEPAPPLLPMALGILLGSEMLPARFPA